MLPARVEQQRLHACPASPFVVIASIVAHEQNSLRRQLQRGGHLSEKLRRGFAPANLGTDYEWIKISRNRHRREDRTQAPVEVGRQCLTNAALVEGCEQVGTIRI